MIRCSVQNGAISSSPASAGAPTASTWSSPAPWTSDKAKTCSWRNCVRAHEPPPDAVMSAVRAIEPSEPQRVKKHRLGVNRASIPSRSRSLNASTQRVTIASGAGAVAAPDTPLTHCGQCSTADELAFGGSVNPQRGQSKSIIPALLETGSRVARLDRAGISPLLAIAHPWWPTGRPRDVAAGTSRCGQDRRGTRA